MFFMFFKNSGIKYSNIKMHGIALKFYDEQLSWKLLKKC